MLLFVVFQSVPRILLLTLVGCLYLVWVDVKDEPDLEFQIKVWWFLLVLLLHVLGFLIFRVWLAVRRRGRSSLLSLLARVQTGKLEREFERQQVLLGQVEPRDSLDPLEPLTHGVRVDVRAPARSPRRCPGPPGIARASRRAGLRGDGRTRSAPPPSCR